MPDLTLRKSRGGETYMMNMLQKCVRNGLVWLDDLFDWSLIWHRRNWEISKFKDKSRVSIYSQVRLTTEQKREIDKLYQSNYGKKIPYTWHRHFMAYTGRFDACYFPELLFIPEFESFMNLDKGYVRAFSDKNVLSLLASAAGVRTPRNYVSCANGLLRDESCRMIEMQRAVAILRDVGEVFIKPTVDSSSGNGCMVANFRNGVDALSERSVQDILCAIGRDFAVQERIRCHSSLRALNPTSVNTFRVITYRWKDSVECMPTILRIGQGGSHLDNAHAGGMFIAVNEDGTLHEKAFTEFKQEFTHHPDTGICYSKQKIEQCPDVVRAACRMHEAIPQLGVVHWDFTLSEDGEPMLIEANTSGGGIWVVEMAHGCGPFGDKTEDVLRWMQKMKHTRKSRRAQYAYGK